MKAILKLIRTIIKYSNSLKDEFYMNNQWSVMDTFFGLLTLPISASYRVPPTLSADLLAVIAEFAYEQKPSIAMMLWEMVEEKQVFILNLLILAIAYWK